MDGSFFLATWREERGRVFWWEVGMRSLTLFVFAMSRGGGGAVSSALGSWRVLHDRMTVGLVIDLVGMVQNKD